MKPTNEITLKEAINQLIEAYHLKPKLNEVKLISYWENQLGKTISKHTKSVVLRGKTLYVELDSAALRQELVYARTRLIEKLNEAIGDQAIEEIIFK